MDVEQLRQDVREGRVKLERLVELIVVQQRQLAEAYARIRELEAALDELRKQSSGTAKIDEAFSMKAEEKRQAARGRKSKKKKPRRRGRFRTADKLALCEREEDVFPEGLDREQCQFSHSRPVWRLIEGRAVLIAYHVYRGPGNEYGKISGTLGRSEFGLEIVVAISYLVYLAGLSFDKVCLVRNLFSGAPAPEIAGRCVVASTGPALASGVRSPVYLAGEFGGGPCGRDELEYPQRLGLSLGKGTTLLFRSA
jgi:transposase